MMPTLLSSSGPSTPLSYVHRRFGSVARSVDPSPSMVPNRQRGSDAPSAVGAPTPPTQLGAFQVSRQPLPPSSLSSQHCYNIAHSSSSYLDPRQRAQSVRPFSTSSLSSQGAAHRPSSTMSMPGSRSLSRQPPPPPPQALHRSMSHLSSTTQQQQQQQQSQHHHSSSQQLPPFSRQEYLPPPPPPPAAATTMGSTFMGGFAQQLQERSRSLHQQTSSSTSVLLASQPPPLRSHTPPGSLAARRAISHSNATRGENVRERGPIMSANSQHEPQRQQYHHHQVAHHPPSDSFHSSFDAARTHPQPLSRGSISQSYAPAPEQQPPTTSNYAQAEAASNFCARGAPAPRPRQQEEEGEDELRRSSAPSTVPTYLQRAAVAMPRPPHTSLSSSFTPQPLPLTPQEQLEPQGRRSGPASSLSADHNQGDTVIIIRKHTSAVTTTAVASTQCNLDECLLDSLRSLQEASASHQKTIASLQRERQELEEKLCAERERRQAAEQRCSDLAAAAVAESAARRERDTFSLPSHQPLSTSPSTATLQRTRIPPTGKKRARSPTSEVSEKRAPEKNDSEHLHHFTGAAMNDAEDGDCSAAAGHAVATRSCPHRVSPTVDHHHHRQEGTLTTAMTKTSTDNVIQVRRRPSFIRKSAAAPTDRGAAYERSIVDIFADLV